jgi:hypothetical protein
MREVIFSIAARFAASPRRSYFAVVVMLVCPASSLTVIRLAPESKRVEI